MKGAGICYIAVPSTPVVCPKCSQSGLLAAHAVEHVMLGHL